MDGIDLAYLVSMHLKSPRAPSSNLIYFLASALVIFSLDLCLFGRMDPNPGGEDPRNESLHFENIIKNYTNIDELHGYWTSIKFREDFFANERHHFSIVKTSLLKSFQDASLGNSNFEDQEIKFRVGLIQSIIALISDFRCSQEMKIQFKNLLIEISLRNQEPHFIRAHALKFLNSNFKTQMDEFEKLKIDQLVDPLVANWANQI